jgi:hypothetical protein
MTGAQERPFVRARRGRNVAGVFPENLGEVTLNQRASQLRGVGRLDQPDQAVLVQMEKLQTRGRVIEAEVFREVL